MDLLIDTNAFLWFCEDNPKLSSIAKKYIENSSNTSFISMASLWEIAIKISLGKMKLKIPFDKFIYLVEENGFEILSITFEHTLVISKLEFHHRDPFDRLIIAQGIVEDIPIISTDSAFDKYKINRIW
jgi:PIN domain nuclease of toxin-antitoxin system